MKFILLSALFFAASLTFAATKYIPPSAAALNWKARQAFAQSPEVQTALKGREIVGHAEALVLATDPDACDNIDTYLVAQVASSEEHGADAVTATVQIEWNSCAVRPIVVRSVSLVQIPGIQGTQKTK